MNQWFQGGAPTVSVYQNDLPEGLDLGPIVAIDSETMGLKLHRDPLCVVQLSSGDGRAHIVQMDRKTYHAPRLKALLSDAGVLKIFHFGRFDIAAFAHYLGVRTAPVYCTKIASKLCRTSTNAHGLRDLCARLLGVEISKEQQVSDWGAPVLSEAQISYAAQDVLYLHALKETLDALLVRENRMALAQACWGFLPDRALLDLQLFDDPDIFGH